MNLDGCDATCKFEQDQRVNALKMQFTTSTTCTQNVLGGAFSGTAQSQIQSGIDHSVTDGSTSILFKMLGLDDLSGTTDPAVGVGIMSGAPFPGAGYDGAHDLDWWYQVDVGSVDGNRDPVQVLSGSIVSQELSAGLGSATLVLNLSGTASPLAFSSLMLTSAIGAVSAPTISLGSTPGHLASENLDPLLLSYATSGQDLSGATGTLCGNISALSLSAVPIPSAFLSGGGVSCSESYNATNSLLDSLVGGCHIFGFITAISKTQPDQENPDVPPAGAGPRYTLSADAQHVVNMCKDVNGSTVDLTACLEDAAYSSYFLFGTDRVIVK